MRKDWASRFETQKGGQITENGRPAPTKVVDIREGTLEHEYGVRIGTKVAVLMGMGCVSAYGMRPTWKSRMFDVNLNTQQAIMSITCSRAGNRISWTCWRGMAGYGQAFSTPRK
jgi:opacity protein-like surface antigen